ncbi:kinesin-like protein KIF6 [Pecten maximus]|uniref:kinesin-like protein KIF6 n=1 Tax=Pecten maximus TaxID=6579 RepID=UPI0014582898|nr:kinesin-like protein KIF6 [Pecten maximus]
MVKHTIQIFARVKPTRSKAGLYDLDDDDDGQPRLTFTVPRDLAKGFINNKKENYKFRFKQVFDQTSKQDDIFVAVSKPVVDNVLSGYNGTIFAYGQTGSGKTFTITGGAERYADRGIIPRSISYLYEQFEKDTERTYDLHISYLEIYNENGFDLLDPKHEASKLEDLPKVGLMEDSDQNIHLKNLSVHQASSEEEALNLLFLGDTNRMIAETPMNQASTRSHCIFTIHVTSRETGSATIRRAKLHLVDLAGSERVGKSGVAGTLLTEAKYINLSLHFLEQVITALSDKNRQHIPYRNSMMTSVLRDSLGGNCMTTMIATCSIEKRNLDESISTCRFAQRVAMIKNDVMVNEELDPKLMIQKLKREIQQLKEELAMATGEQRTDDLTDEDLERCQKAVEQYLEDTDPDVILSIGADMRKIQTCFRILKKHVLEKPSVTEVIRSPPPEAPPPDTGPYSDAENSKLKELVQQRDNEINILVNMLKKEKKRASNAESELTNMGKFAVRTSSVAGEAPSYNNVAMSRESTGSRNSRPNSSRRREEQAKNKILGDMSQGRQEAFEIFRRDYPQKETIEQNKVHLKQRYAEAKSLGEKVNKTRKKINHLKGQIEQHRMQLAMQGLVDPNNPEPDEEEQELRADMEEEKDSYKHSFNRLKTLKTEIEHLQHLLEKSKVKLMKDFEMWWAEQALISQNTQSVGGSMKSAWRTPTPKQSRKALPPDHVSPGNSTLSQSSSASSLYQPASHSLPLQSYQPASHSQPPQVGHHRQKVAVQLSSFYSQPPSQPQPPVEKNGYRLPRSAGNDQKAGIPLTGDSKADADIMAFVKARQNILKQANGNR